MRLVYLDNLRAILMLLGIVLHTCAAFSVSAYWLVTYAEPVIWADAINQLIHIFRMPLFFIISGFFGSYLLNKYSLKAFITNKMLRIGLPLVTAMLIFNTVQAWLLASENKQGFAEAYQQVGSGHLWFLFNLLVYFIALVLIRVCLQRIASSHWRDYSSLLLLLSFGCFPLGYILLLALGKSGIPIYFPLPLFTSFYVLFSYFDYFLLGAVLGALGHQVCWQKWYQHKVIIVGLAVLSISVVMLITHNNVIQANYALLHEVSHIIQTRWLTMVSCILILLIAKNTLNYQGRVLAVLCASSYSVYLVHHVLIFTLVVLCNSAYYSGLELPAEVAFVLVLGLTWLCSVLLHIIICQNKILRLAVNGKAI